MSEWHAAAAAVTALVILLIIAGLLAWWLIERPERHPGRHGQHVEVASAPWLRGVAPGLTVMADWCEDWTDAQLAALRPEPDERIASDDTLQLARADVDLALAMMPSLMSPVAVDRWLSGQPLARAGWLRR